MHARGGVSSHRPPCWPASPAAASVYCGPRLGPTLEEVSIWRSSTTSCMTDDLHNRQRTPGHDALQNMDCGNSPMSRCGPHICLYAADSATHAAFVSELSTTTQRTQVRHPRSCLSQINAIWILPSWHQAVCEAASTQHEKAQRVVVRRKASMSLSSLRIVLLLFASFRMPFQFVWDNELTVEDCDLTSQSLSVSLCNV